MTDLLREALARFEEVFARARETEASEPTAVILATADARGTAFGAHRAPQGRG